MQDLDTRKTLALKLHISIPTLIRWENRGMPVIRIGGIVRYDYSKVMEWVNLIEVSKGITK